MGARRGGGKSRRSPPPPPPGKKCHYMGGPFYYLFSLLGAFSLVWGPSCYFFSRCGGLFGVALPTKISAGAHAHHMIAHRIVYKLTNSISFINPLVLNFTNICIFHFENFTILSEHVCHHYSVNITIIISDSRLSDLFVASMQIASEFSNMIGQTTYFDVIIITI